MTEVEPLALLAADPEPGLALPPETIRFESGSDGIATTPSTVCTKFA